MKSKILIKKTATIVLLALLVLPLFSMSAVSRTEGFKLQGDLNMDGKVDSADVSMTMKMLIGLEPQNMRADFNDNGRVDIGDAARIAFFVVEKTFFLREPPQVSYELHADLSSVRSQECLVCHSNIPQESSLDPTNVTAVHPTHLNSNWLKFECNTCHKKVDLDDRSAEALRKNVDPEFCATCHSPFPVPPMEESYKELDCITCHADWKDRMVNATYVNFSAIEANPTNTTCLYCHGEPNVWYEVIK